MCKEHVLSCFHVLYVPEEVSGFSGITHLKEDSIQIYREKN
jgi:hypothetical protein